MTRVNCAWGMEGPRVRWMGWWALQRRERRGQRIGKSPRLGYQNPRSISGHDTLTLPPGGEPKTRLVKGRTWACSADLVRWIAGAVNQLGA